MERDLLQGAEPRVFVTQENNPEEGLTFVWARAQWYERVEGEMGNVAFVPIADSEEDLRQWLSSEADQSDLTEVDDDYARLVTQEFLEQAPLYPEASELSDEEPFREQKANGGESGL
jgi:hypothetical protein